jgi:hypothetical protein
MHLCMIVKQTDEKPIVVDEFNHDERIKVTMIWYAFIVNPQMIVYLEFVIFDLLFSSR